MKDIVIVGAGGYGLEILQYVKDACAEYGGFAPKGLLDDDPKLHLLTGSDARYLGTVDDYAVQDKDAFLISIGDPEIRYQLATRLARKGARFFTLVHPKAHVSPSAKLAAGCIISPFATVGSHSVVGENVLLVAYACIGHDCTVGACSSFSPYSIATGGSRIGSRVFLGSHSVVTPMGEVGDQCKIASGAITYRTVPNRHFAFGNPAKVLPIPMMPKGRKPAS
jgi:sugar O-acyltransferase (sialic acid O-acetyltransferase NeuD family)